MRVAVFSTKPYDRASLAAAAEGSGHDLDFFEARLCCDHAPLAAGFPAVCAFVHDELDAKLLRDLASGGTRLVALRAAGFNNVDLAVAREVGIRVAPRARLLTPRRRRARGGAHPEPRAAHPARLQPRPRGQLRPGRAARLRPPRPLRRASWALAASARSSRASWPASAAGSWPTTPIPNDEMRALGATLRGPADALRRVGHHRPARAADDRHAPPRRPGDAGARQARA